MTKRHGWVMNDRLRSEATRILGDAAAGSTSRPQSVPSGKSSTRHSMPNPTSVASPSTDATVTKREKLQSLTAALDTRPPQQIPRWLTRLAAGPAARLLTVSHRISSARITDATGWNPAAAAVVSSRADVIDERTAGPTGRS